MRRRCGLAVRSWMALVIVALAVTACGPVAPRPDPPRGTAAAASPTSAASPTIATPRPTPDRVAGWHADLAALLPGMAALHPDLDHATSRQALDDAVAALDATVETATEDELLVGLLKIVAMVSPGACDSHTGAYVWGTGTYPVESLPLRLWLFGDEVVIVDALPADIATRGSRLDSIEGHPIAEVLAALRPLIPRDNDQTVRLLAPRFLLMPQVLRGLGLAPADGPIRLGLTPPIGDPTTLELEPIPMADYNTWAGAYGLHLPVDPEVLYLSRIDDALWWQILPDAATLFVQWNRVERPSPAIVGDLRKALHGADVERVILDLRHNVGGELTGLDQVLALFEDPAIDQPDRLFVAIGRNTYSAGSLAVARLERDTMASFLGEPTGGCPTVWGNTRPLVLPASGIEVSVATERSVGVDADDPRTTIEPDVIAPLTVEEWLEGRDPVLEQIVLGAP